MMWPAAYHYLGVSGQGDKGFNEYGKQAADQGEGQTYKDGKLIVHAQVEPVQSRRIPLRRRARHPARDGALREEFKKLYG